MRVDPWFGKQDLTWPGRPSLCAARPSTAKVKTRRASGAKPGACAGSCCHRHLCWHRPAGEQAFSIRHGAPRQPASRSHWFRRGGGTRKPGPRHPTGGALTLHTGQSQDGSLRPTSLHRAGGPRMDVLHRGRSACPPRAGLVWVDAFTALTGSQGPRNGAWCREVFRRRSREHERGRVAFSLRRRFPAERLAGKGSGTCCRPTSLVWHSPLSQR